MAAKTKEQEWADWLALVRSGSIPQLLDAKALDGQYKILARLLCEEFGRSKSFRHR